MKPNWNLWLYRALELKPVGQAGIALIVMSLFTIIGSAIPALIEAQEIKHQQKAITKGSSQAAPALRTIDTALRHLFAAAKTNGVRIERGEYSVAEKGASAPTKIALSMPVRGDYPSIRKFLSQALNDNPGLVLEQIRLSRSQANHSELAGSLRFTLAVRSPK